MAYSKKRCSLWLRIVCQMDVSQKTETSPGISNSENLIEGIFYNSYGIAEKINRMRQQLSHQWQQEGRDDWGLPEPRAGAMWQGTSLGVTAWQAYGYRGHSSLAGAIATGDSENIALSGTSSEAERWESKNTFPPFISHWCLQWAKSSWSPANRGLGMYSFCVTVMQGGGMDQRKNRQMTNTRMSGKDKVGKVGYGQITEGFKSTFS